MISACLDFGKTLFMFHNFVLVAPTHDSQVPQTHTGVSNAGGAQTAPTLTHSCGSEHMGGEPIVRVLLAGGSHLDERAADLAGRALGAVLAVSGAQVARVDRGQAVLGVPVCLRQLSLYLSFAGVLGERGSVGVRAAVGLRVGARGLAGDADLDAELRPTPGRSRREGRAERPRAKDGAAPRMDDGESAHLGEGAARFVRGALGGRTADLGGRGEAVLGVRAAVLGGLAHGAGLRHRPRGQPGTSGGET